MDASIFLIVKHVACMCFIYLYLKIDIHLKPIMSYNGSMRSNQQGQVLLVVIMVIATISTIILTATYQSVNQTRITKLQEDNQKALAAAEAGIEHVIAIQQRQPLSNNNASYKDMGLTGLENVDENNSTIKVSTARDSEVTSPVIEKDQTFTFYLADYSNQTFSNYYDQPIILYAGTAGSDCTGRNMPALELIFLTENTDAIRRNIVEPCPTGNIITPSDIATIQSQVTIQGENFAYHTPPINVPNNTKLLVVKVLFGETKLGFRAESGLLPPQGTHIVSEAQLETGVTKVVELIQLYPQIPSTFLFTSF